MQLASRSGIRANHFQNSVASFPATLNRVSPERDDLTTTWFSPGRIEVLGKHTDYAGGRSLLAALDRGVTVRVDPTEEGLTASSDAMPGTVVLGEGPLPMGHWGNYLNAAVARLARNFRSVRPGHLSVSSTLPLASGMSSSSALLVASTLALAHHSGIDRDDRWVTRLNTPEALATYLACIENGSSFGDLEGDRGVGTFGGSEDHTAMVCCHPSELAQYSFTGSQPVREASISFPDDLTFVVVMSGVLAEKTGPALKLYNRSSELVKEIVLRWNRATNRTDANIGQAISVDPDAQERLVRLVADDAALRERLSQFLAESEEYVPAGADALSRRDLTAFGAVSAASWQAADSGLHNQINETRHLASRAVELGAHASSPFGAGYGGSVWALTSVESADALGQAWLDDYLSAYPQNSALASVLVTRPSGGVRQLG